MTDEERHEEMLKEIKGLRRDVQRMIEVTVASISELRAAIAKLTADPPPAGRRHS